ncbi:MAG: hypothetical protein ABIO29_05495 [Sphingomicrobium sp.]
MTLLLKNPDAVLDYSIDWGAEYLDGELIAASAWSVEPAETGGVTIVSADFSSSATTVKAAGGAVGKLYRLVNQVTTDSGRIDSRSISLRVEKR